ncbi:MAG: ferredoxin [Bacteriovoracaceae bacterium]|nr:ferredoxin [Bacteriovoracaceae bacterium]
MNTTLIAMGIAALLAIGLVVNVAVISLLSGGFHFLFARPRLDILKSEFGDHGFAFSFSWNNAREPAKFDKVKVRLFNPFGTPTQVEVSKAFNGANSNFARDVYMGIGMKKLLAANGLGNATIEIEVSSSTDGLNQSFSYRAVKFLEMLGEATSTVKKFEGELPPAASKPLFQTVQRSFISEPLPESGKTIKLSTNPEFAGEFASAGTTKAAEENYSVSKVWIDPGCIVCNACEAIYPEVFEVTDDTCLIRPEAPLDNGLLIQEAAEACPVEVIKFTKAG